MRRVGNRNTNTSLAAHIPVTKAQVRADYQARDTNDEGGGKVQRRALSSPAPAVKGARAYPAHEMVADAALRIHLTLQRDSACTDFDHGSVNASSQALDEQPHGARGAACGALIFAGEPVIDRFCFSQPRARMVRQQYERTAWPPWRAPCSAQAACGMHARPGPPCERQGGKHRLSALPNNPLPDNPAPSGAASHHTGHRDLPTGSTNTLASCP